MISRQELMERVDRVDYWHPAKTTVTVCCLVFKNGMSALGWSACADPKEFDSEQGKQYALDDAVERSLGFIAWEQANEQLF